MNNPSLLICPACGTALEWSEKACRCANGHAFDLAKEGYANLLLSHQRRSGHPGDDAAMIQARRRFFDSGAFNPVTERIKKSALGNHPSAILDCGCGEGALLGAIGEAYAGRLFGVDISKDAVRCAAKRYKRARWIVANAMRQLPFADHSLDVILSVLAPRNPAEFARVLKPGGIALLGVPGPNHLIELRARLAEKAADFEEKADEAAQKCAPQLVEVRREAVRYEQILHREQLADLIQMTPIFWCSAPEAKAAVQQLDGLAVTVSFTLLTMQAAYN